MQRTQRTLLTALAAASLLATAFTGSAAAGGRDEAPGQTRKAEAATVTEDTDTNDGGTPNNVVDDGDNRHPSGKDRSVERGGSGIHGRSTSDPDDDGRGPDRSNGGPDKPGGAGGVDLADQDGNNGCGNDDDFEDDNEGWCGRKPEPAPVEAAEAGVAATTTGCPAGAMTGHAAAAAGACDTPAAEGDVLSSAAVADACALAGLFGAATMPDDCVLAAAGVAQPVSALSSGEVLAAGVTSGAPASVTVTADSPNRGSVLGTAVSGARGALAATGLNALTILLAGLVALALGTFLVRASRRQH